MAELLNQSVKQYQCFRECVFQILEQLQETLPHLFVMCSKNMATWRRLGMAELLNQSVKQYQCSAEEMGLFVGAKTLWLEPLMSDRVGEAQALLRCNFV